MMGQDGETQAGDVLEASDEKHQNVLLIGTLKKKFFLNRLPDIYTSTPAL